MFDVRAAGVFVIHDDSITLMQHKKGAGSLPQYKLYYLLLASSTCKP